MNLPSSTVLLIEDEIPLAQTLSLALTELRYQVIHFTNLLQAFDFLSRTSMNQVPRLVLLDRRLPDGDGIQFCTELRKKKYDGGILMLTAHGEVQDRVSGLNAGADDYLSKPFSWEELKARIQALSRRNVHTPRTDHSLWQKDQNRLQVFGKKGWVQLTPLEYKLVSKLIDAQGEIVSRESLLKEVWGYRFLPQTRTVDFFMGKLRKYFESEPDQPKHFVTVRGAGFKFQE